MNNKVIQAFFSAKLPLVAAVGVFLKKRRFRPEKIKGILVRNGVGAFTATRVGTTVANTLGMAWNVPVDSASENESWESAAARLENKGVRYALPRYSAPAHIGGQSHG